MLINLMFIYGHHAQSLSHAHNTSEGWSLQQSARIFNVLISSASSAVPSTLSLMMSRVPSRPHHHSICRGFWTARISIAMHTLCYIWIANALTEDAGIVRAVLACARKYDSPCNLTLRSYRSSVRRTRNLNVITARPSQDLESNLWALLGHVS